MEAYSRYLRHRYISKLTGSGNIPPSGAFVLAFNHDSFMDPFYIWSILFPDSGDRKLCFIAQINAILNKLINMLMKNYAVTLLVDLSTKDRVVEQAAAKLAQGHVVAITPEGVIRRSSTLRKGKTGAARLALNARSCVVPVGIRTDYYVWHIREILRWLVKPKTKAVIEIGEALHFEHHYGKPINEQLLAEVTADIMQEIGKLCGKDCVPYTEIERGTGTLSKGQDT